MYHGAQSSAELNRVCGFFWVYSYGSLISWLVVITEQSKVQFLPPTNSFQENLILYQTFFRVSEFRKIIASAVLLWWALIALVFLNMGHSQPPSSFIFGFSDVLNTQLVDKILLILIFEPHNSGIRGNRSTN